jgi:hypothetical protein
MGMVKMNVKEQIINRKCDLGFNQSVSLVDK